MVFHVDVILVIAHVIVTLDKHIKQRHL